MKFFADINTIIGATTMVLMGVSAIFTFIPGDQPEKTLDKITKILTKISRKKKNFLR